MQTKKDEIRKTILEAAQKEFLIHGYEGASMRTIAKKANTTLGNIYHYYENKEAILEELLREPVEKVKKMIDYHVKLQDDLYTMAEMQELLGDLDNLMDYHEMQCLLDERLVILFDLRTTHFVKIRDDTIHKFKQHLAWHLGMDDDDSAYVDIIMNTFIACVRHVLSEHKGTEESKKEFIKVFKVLCAGVMSNRKEEE